MLRYALQYAVVRLVLLTLVGVAPLTGGCSVVSPPPLLPAHGLAQPLPENAVSVSLIAGLGGGVFIDENLGLAVQIGYQIRADKAVGVSVGVGRRMDVHQEADRPLNWLVPVRVFGRWNPDLERPWWALTFGVGAGWGDVGLSYLTFDGGARVSTGGGIVDVYAQPALALSIPLSGPPISDERVRTTLYGGLSVGVIGNGDGALAGSLDLSALVGASLEDSGTMGMLSGAVGYREGP